MASKGSGFNPNREAIQNFGESASEKAPKGHWLVWRCVLAAHARQILKGRPAGEILRARAPSGADARWGTSSLRCFSSKPLRPPPRSVRLFRRVGACRQAICREHVVGAGPNPRGRCLQQRAERLCTNASCSRTFALNPGRSNVGEAAADSGKGGSGCSSGGPHAQAAGHQAAQSGPSRSISSASLLSGSSAGHAQPAEPIIHAATSPCPAHDAAAPPRPPEQTAVAGVEPLGGVQSMRRGGPTHHGDDAVAREGGAAQACAAANRRWYIEATAAVRCRADWAAKSSAAADHRNTAGAASGERPWQAACQPTTAAPTIAAHHGPRPCKSL